MDNFTETKYTNLGQNIGSSIMGTIFGLFLIVGSIVLLWWNESSSVSKANALREMQGNIITLQSPIYDAKNNNKPILLSGEVKPLQELLDPVFSVKSNGLTLKREVQMYQWKEDSKSESKKKLGGGTETVTTYNYTKIWSSTKGDSSNFKHQEGHSNPEMNYKNKKFTTNATLGDFSLNSSVVNHIDPYKEYVDLSKLPKELNGASNHGSFLYIGKDANNPQIGDLKITYRYAPAGTYTFAAMQTDKNIKSYTTSNGKNFLFVRSGKASANEIFADELNNNSVLTWVFRVMGLLVMFFGFILLMGLVQTLANIIPLFGNILGVGTSIIATILTAILGSIVIALAWFTARPMVTLIVLLIGFAIALALKKLKQKPLAPISNSTPPPRR